MAQAIAPPHCKHVAARHYASTRTKRARQADGAAPSPMPLQNLGFAAAEWSGAAGGGGNLLPPTPRGGGAPDGHAHAVLSPAAAPLPSLPPLPEPGRLLAADATVDMLCGGVVCTTLLSGADYFFNKRGVVANRAPPPRPARRRDRVRSKPRRYRR